MSFTDEFTKKIVYIITELAREKLGGRMQEARSDAGDFLNKTKTDINRWVKLLRSGELEIEEFIWLVKSKKDLLEMTALKQTGLSLVELEEFRDSILHSLIKVAFGLLTKSISGAAANRTSITDAFVIEEFSLKDKIMIIGGILGGYSFLPADEYVISYMKENHNGEVNWDKINKVFRGIANTGANATREFPWWCLSISEAKRLVPFAFDENKKKFDLSQLDNNNYFTNLGKIARLANLYRLTFIYDIYNGSEARVKKAGNFSPWNGNNNIQGLSDYFYGADAAEYREQLELKVIETLKGTDFMLELCNEPSVKGAEALAETYIRLINNGVPGSRIINGWDYNRKKQNEKGAYAAAYRKWRNLIVDELGEEWGDKIKQESWSTMHQMNVKTLNDYLMSGLEPGQEVPSNTLRNTIFDMDGIRDPRPDSYDAHNLGLMLINLRRKAIENGRVGIGAVYGKEKGFIPTDSLEGISRVYKEKFGKFPKNYMTYPEPLPLPPWINDDQQPPGNGVPRDLFEAINSLKEVVIHLLQAKVAVENQWGESLPVFKKYRIV